MFLPGTSTSDWWSERGAVTIPTMRWARRMVSTRLTLAYEAGLLSQANAPMRLDPADDDAIPHYSTHVQGADLVGSLRDLWAVVAGPLQQPFTADELDRAAEAVRAELELDVERGQFRGDSYYASKFTAHFVGGADLRAAAERQRSGIAALVATSADELNAYYAWMLGRTAPVVVAAGPPGVALPAFEELRAALDCPRADVGPGAGSGGLHHYSLRRQRALRQAAG